MAAASKPLRTVLAAGLVTGAIYYACRLFSHMSAFMVDSRAQLCGDSEWAWSPYSDCFRSGFLWPALLLFTAGLLASVLAACFILPQSVSATDSSGFACNGSSLLARLSVGNMKAPVRCPPGPVVAVDNRLQIGTIITALLAVQTVLFSVWSRSTSSNDKSTLLYPAALAQSAALCFVFAFACLIVYAHSNRLLYNGLFPWILPAFVGIQLSTGLIDVYFSFFTIENSKVPIFGRSASIRSNLLVVTTTISFVLTILFSSVQHRIIFTRPLDDTGATNLGSSYIQLANETEYADDSDSTPFGHSHEQKENKLADTPEFSSSWFDKLTFSWSNNLMRKGSLRQLQHSDLYKLNKSDMPVSVWRRYRRHRKPGRSLAVAVALALAPELLLQFACTTVMRCVNFTGPFFLQRIIRSIELSRNNSSEISSRRLYLDAFGLLFFNLVAALMLVQVRWMGHHNIIRVKGLLVAELSSKTLRRRGKDSRKKQNIGSKNKKKHTQSAASAADDGKVMNLLTADFQAIATSFDVMRNISSMGVALGIGIWYMYQMLGVSA
ncbi:Transporter of the ATP-binding cassette (ABC), partial [Coemansia sp. RSA 1358]